MTNELTHDVYEQRSFWPNPGCELLEGLGTKSCDSPESAEQKSQGRRCRQANSPKLDDRSRNNATASVTQRTLDDLVNQHALYGFGRCDSGETQDVSRQPSGCGELGME